jgi:hypothetical protein
MTSNLLKAPATDETGLGLPQLLNAGLAANDRLKYYLTLLQVAGAYSQQPYQPVSNLRAEREAGGITDSAFDDIVSGSRLDADGHIHIPGAQRVRGLLLDALRQMLQPVQTAAGVGVSTQSAVETYVSRLRALTAGMPLCADDRVLPDEIASVASLGDGDHDSVHQLVIDLHRELNQLQAKVFRESVDGAKTYGLTDADRELVRAFMKGVNATAARKFDHPGLGTTATRSGDRLSIQNDLGTTDAHVVVIHIRDLTATIVYSDIHVRRVHFFQNMLEPCGVTWAPGSSGKDSVMVIGQIDAIDRQLLAERLSALGSRLVFLIDWNRARKCLKRFISGNDAIAVLKSAADENVGHRGFLQAGGARLIYTALERATRASVRYGARLDDLLGPDAARAFLLSVMRLAAEGLEMRRSPPLIQDQIEAEVLTHLPTPEQSAIGLAAEHAMVLAAVAERVRYVSMRASTNRWQEEVTRGAELCNRWEARANEIVSRSHRLRDQRSADRALRHLVDDADKVVDALEEYAFLLALLPARRGRDTISRLALIANVVGRSAREYVRCLEHARGIARQPIRSEVDEILLAGDRVAQLERDCRTMRRRVQVEAAQRSNDAVPVQLTWQAVSALEAAAAALTRCTLVLRDFALTEVSPAHD